MSNINMPQDALLERFMRYVAVDTQSKDEVEAAPSTEKQKDLGKILVGELKAMGLADAEMDDKSVVMATLKGNTKAPVIGFIAHLDTSPEVSGKNVKPQIHKNYQGGEIRYPGNPDLVLSPANCSYLSGCVGEDIITSDGTTLLGADDKAGIAAIMTAVQYLLDHPEIPRGDIRIAFTPDEEVGRGTENFDIAKFGAKCAYTLDGGLAGELSDETFNADGATVTIRGINTHPGKAKDVMVNAIQVLGDFLSELPRDMTPQTTDGREGFIHPVSVEGGVDHVTAKLILRDFDPQKLEAQNKLMHEIAAKVQGRYPGSSVEVEIKRSYRNMKLYLENSPEVVEFAMQAYDAAGVEAFRLPIRGGTDGSELSRKGLPTPNLFTGGAFFHSLTEWASLQQMAKASEVVVHLASLWAKQG